MAAIHDWTWDLFLTAFLASVATVVVLTGIGSTPLSVAVVLPLLLLLPGYALVSALFPRRADERGSGVVGRRPALLERLVLALGLSVAIVPGVAFMLSFTPIGIRAVPIVLIVFGVTVGLCFLAFVGRVLVGPHVRFRVSSSPTFRSLAKNFSIHRVRLSDSGPLHPETGTQRLLNIALFVSMLALVGSVAFVAGVPSETNTSFTELYLLQQNESGDLVAEGLSDRLVSGERSSVVVAIGNHEGERVQYTVVILEQDGEHVDGSYQVQTEREVTRFRATIDHAETLHERVDVSSLNRERGRLVILLYRGEPPQTPAITNAYRVDQLWLESRSAD